MKEPHQPGQPDTRWENSPLAGKEAALQEMEIRLRITEPELISEIAAYPEGRIRDDFIRTALRIGVMALRQAEGQIDSQAVRQASLRSRERFWDIRVPKIDSIFDNSLVPRPSWSPGVPPQHRKLVAATHRSPI